MRIAILLAALTVVGLSACSTYDTRLSSSSLRSSDNQNLGTVFAWDNDVSAAVAYPPSSVRTADGDRHMGITAICMQRAMTAGATAASGKLDVSKSILGLAQIPNDGSGNLGEAALNISKSVLSLSVSTERTAFIDTGLFYLCQLAANGALSDTQLTTALTSLFDAAGKLGASSATPSSLQPLNVPVSTLSGESKSTTDSPEAAKKAAEDTTKKAPA